MRSYFSNILIPVDFSINTEIAVQKAMLLSRQGTTVIHLLHVINNTFRVGGYYLPGLIMPVPPIISAVKTNCEYQLEAIKRSILDSSSNIDVRTHLVENMPIQDSIINTARMIQTDLIIIGRSKNHNWFPFLKTINTNKISKETKCAVLTIKPGCLSNRIKSVVIPIGSTKPERKIELLSAITGSNRPKVYLVSIFRNADADKWTGVILDTYRTLTQHLHYPVEYDILTGNNTAKAIYTYARSVRADMIIINSNEESKINPLSGKQTNDLIRPNSKLNVLTA